jgi:hypothetical protein
MIKMPEIKQDYYPLGGGLDLVSPAINIDPGKVIDSQNYEPAIEAGYRRIDGYERYDGRASPSSANYWILPVPIGASIAAGTSILGATSAATAVVLAVRTGYLVVGRLVGTFQVGELLLTAP